jgi:hypothetical protein
MSHLFSIWIALTQSSTVSMPRRPMIIFDPTAVSGTVLLLTPRMKGTTLLPALKTIANEVEKEVGSTAAQFWRHGPVIPELTLGVELGSANQPDLLGQNCVARKVTSRFCD